MKRTIKRILLLSAVMGVFAIQGDGHCDNDCIPSPTFVPRSQGTNSVLKLVGSVGETHLYDMDCWWGTFALTALYQQSFRAQRITDCLFGADAQCGIVNCGTSISCDPCNDCDSNTRSILIQGSAVTNRNSRAWLADYFYLPTDFQSQISFRPRIKSFLLNFDFYLGLDEWVCGMYFRTYGPITWTKWDLNFCETICSTGSNSFTAGYFAPVGIQRSSLLTDFTQYAAGASPAEVGGVTFNGLNFARIDNCSDSRTGFADLWIELGWDFLNCEDYHFGVGILAGAPTGSKRRACRVFDPVVGNGNHWQLGGVLTGHYVFWRSCEEDKFFGFYLDANVTHLFGAREERTFDLCGRPNSRYMLAERLSSTVSNGLMGDPNAGTTDGTAATAQFANQFTPVANLTTFDSKVKVGAQGDVTAMFNFTGCGFSWDFGYNFWGRSCESIDCDFCPTSCSTVNLCDQSQDSTWALKGDGRVFGFAGETTASITVNTAVALSATQSRATIHGGTNATATTATNVVFPALQNQGVDNAQFARAGAAGTKASLLFAPTTEGAFNIDSNQIKTSIQPIFLRCEDIDFRGTKGISHKVFTHLSYIWDCECWIPYIGIGGSAEFGKSCGNNDCCPTTACTTSCPTTICNTSCSSCTDCALSQWAIWLKGGVSFN